DIRSGTDRRVQVQIVSTGRSQVDTVRPSSTNGDDGVAQDLSLNLQAPLQDVWEAKVWIDQRNIRSGELRRIGNLVGENCGLLFSYVGAVGTINIGARRLLR